MLNFAVWAAVILIYPKLGQVMSQNFNPIHSQKMRHAALTAFEGSGFNSPILVACSPPRGVPSHKEIIYR